MFGRGHPFWVPVVCWVSSLTAATGQSLTDAQVSLVSQRLAEGASHRRVCPLLHIACSPDCLKAGSTAPVPKLSWSTTLPVIPFSPLLRSRRPSRFLQTCRVPSGTCSPSHRRSWPTAPFQMETSPDHNHSCKIRVPGTRRALALSFSSRIGPGKAPRMDWTTRAPHEISSPSCFRKYPRLTMAQSPIA